MKNNSKDSTKDPIGSLILTGTAVILTFWLSLAGAMRHWQYYIWALFVSLFWGEAMYRREPELYKETLRRRITFLMMGFTIAFSVWSLHFILTNPEMLNELMGTLPETPTPTPVP
jgi:hypothetical protein